MSFQAPWLFLLLLVVIALAALYVVLQSRRKQYAVRFSNLELLSSVAPKRPGWRRHVPAAVVGASLVFLVVGLAQPVHETQVANESRIVMLAIDVSKSMEATDVSPSRLEAAQSAAEEFTMSLPQGYEVGLVSYSDSAILDVPPTTNHRQVANAISQLKPDGSTASGDAIMTSLQAIKAARAAAGINSDSAAAKSAAIVLLSDGDQKVGVTLEQASAAAAKAGVPVSTITFGTASGTVTSPEGIVIPVPPNPQAMAAVAQATGGKAFDAASASELSQVYSQIQGDVGVTTEVSQLWQWFVALAFLALLGACVASFIWTNRFL